MTLLSTLAIGLPQDETSRHSRPSSAHGAAKIIFVLGGFALTIEVILLNLAALIFKNSNPKMVIIAIALFSVGGIIGRVASPFMLEKLHIKMRNMVAIAILFCIGSSLALYVNPQLIHFSLQVLARLFSYLH